MALLVLDLRGIDVLQRSLPEEVGIEDSHNLPISFLLPKVLQPCNSVHLASFLRANMVHELVELTCFNLVSIFHQYFFDERWIFEYEGEDGLNVIFGDVFSLISFPVLLRVVLPGNWLWIGFDFYLLESGGVVSKDYIGVMLVHDALNIDTLIALNGRFLLISILLYDGLLNSIRLSRLLTLGVISNK